MKLARHLVASFAIVSCSSFVACDDSRPHEGAIVLPTGPRFVVRHGDYSSSAFSLLDVDGSVLSDDWIDSGSTTPGLTAAISGDTDVPTVNEPGILTILDRYSVDVLTRIRMEDRTVLGQVRVQGASSTGFSSNPQDVLYVDSRTAWVSRYSHNELESSDGDVKGSDLVEINPTTMARTGARIDLTSLQLMVDVQGTSGTTTLPARVRPKKIVRVGNFAAVGLDMLTQGYEASGPGRMALVDLTSTALTTFELGALHNCGGIAPVPGQPTYVAIVCAGFEYDQKIEQSGVVIVAIDGTTGAMTEIRRYESADYASEDYLFDAVTMIDEDEFVGIHLGGYSPTDPPDSLVHVDMATGARTTLFTSTHGSDLFVTPAYDELTGLFLVPDKSVGVRRFTRGANGAFVESGTILLDGHGLPAISVAVLR